MDKSYLLIGEAAAWLGVTEKALRHYEKVGLIAPERGENGYRLYQAEHLLRLERIRRLQDLGLSLRQIERILDQESSEEQWRALLESLLDDIDAQLELLEDRRERIAQLLSEPIPVEPVELPATVVDVQAHLGGIGAAQLAAERRFHAMLERVEGAGLALTYDPAGIERRRIDAVAVAGDRWSVIGYQSPFDG